MGVVRCRVVGITLSKEQKALAEEKVRAKNLEHLIHFELIDYRWGSAEPRPRCGSSAHVMRGLCSAGSSRSDTLESSTASSRAR
jgi:hypothetical protein